MATVMCRRGDTGAPRCRYAQVLQSILTLSPGRGIRLVTGFGDGDVDPSGKILPGGVALV